MVAHAMSPGTMLGDRYRLEVLLTEHHGARFWRATDTILSRSVAVHTLASTDDRAQAVLDAARRSVTVNDAHFLRVLDCDDDGEITWVINEWGQGMSLDLMLEQRGPLPVDRAAWLVHEVARAMANAHEGGLHHGRLNPEAVLVTEAGSVKVIGFVTHSAFEGPQPPDPTYGDLDNRERDVIDLAGLLYAALTGKWPGVSRSQVPAAPRDGRAPLRPRQVRAGIPRNLDLLCDRVLNKEGAQHALPVETSQEIAAALSDFIGSPTGPIAPIHGPLDAASMHVEPTRAIRLPLNGDPDATHAAAPPRHEDTANLAPVEPFEQPEDRPLFASAPRRVPQGAPVPPPARGFQQSHAPSSVSTTGTHGTGTGSGAFWPFEPDQEASGFSGREGTWSLRTAAVMAVVIALLAAVFFAVNYVSGGGSDDPENGRGGVVGQKVDVVTAKDFDPESDDGSENPSTVGRAVDDDKSSGWRTVRYRRSPQLGNLKSGVGIVLDLGSERSLKSVSLEFGGKPTTFELYAAPEGTPAIPGDLAGLVQVGGGTATDTSFVVRPESAKTRFLVVWLTSLPGVGGGDYRGEIRDVTVYE